MALKTKCIKEPIEQSDGIRISVMSRHTRDDGVTPDPEITEELYDRWLPILGPPPKLIGAYCRRCIDWNTYKLLYATHLGEKALSTLREIIALAKSRDVTLMCVEPAPDHCHRKLLAEKAQELDPELSVIIR